MIVIKRKGLIVNNKTFSIDWFKKNAMVPITLPIYDSVIRIFIGFCDNNNVGRIGFIDVNANNPKKIINYSRFPSLDIGRMGSFDDSGVIPSCVMRVDKHLYLFYSGYQLCKNVPYMIFSGCAVSSDNGQNFKRVKETPILERVPGELCVRAAPSFWKNKSHYELLYLAGSDWVNKNNHLMPSYCIKRIKTDNVINFDDKIFNYSGEVLLDINMESEEFALAMPKIFYIKSKLRMIYSVRTLSSGYKIGYAESEDNGNTWIRLDDRVFVEDSKENWDSEMMCFSHLHLHEDKIYMFYSGNHYGMGGIGFAEIEVK